MAVQNKLPIIAIVGRANIGKSSLFNAIVGHREAIVANEPGTTRDNVIAKTYYMDYNFWLVDTAGYKQAEDDFESSIQEQISQATESADVILVMVEADVPVTEEDRRIAKIALKSQKEVILVINKADKNRNLEFDAYRKLGIKQIVATSTTQKTGIDELLDQIINRIPKKKSKESTNKIVFSLLGRPNVGKSCLFNALSKKQQAIVSSRSGTTRDINRSSIKYKNFDLTLLDTAGIRKSGKIERGIEHFSVLRSLEAIEQADVCLLLMDVNELGVQLDQKIAGLIKDAGKGLILIVTKWDSFEKDPYTRDNIAAKITREFEFTPWAPLIFISSVTGQNVSKILDIVLEIYENRSLKIKTSELNRWLQITVNSHPPAGLKNTYPKLNYIVQLDGPPPTFKIFGKHTKTLHWSYKRYLEKQLRLAFGFEGTAINIQFSDDRNSD